MSTDALPAAGFALPRDSSIDDLDRAIVSLAARINAASHDLLVLIRRFDERGGWLRWGFPSCAEWLHWRCDVSLSAAREKVRTAHALKTLPAMSLAFAEGKLSYSKARALTRVANRENEEALLAFALRATAAQVEERCRELRWGTDASTDEANRAHARRALTLRRDYERGTATISVELPLETAELIDKALDRALDRMLEAEGTSSSSSSSSSSSAASTSASSSSASPSATTTSAPSASLSAELAGESWQAMRADGLVAMAKEYLSGGSENGSAGVPEHYQVVVHVDQKALAGGEGRSGLPVETARRIACDCDQVVIVEDEEGEPLSIGRKSRSVPAGLRRAVWARDRGCRYPGCGRRRFAHIHHVILWALGGETSLPNLLLLCERHHRQVHEGRFTIEKDYRNRWFFRGPDGRAVPDCGYRAEDMTDDVAVAAEEYFNVDPSREGFTASRPFTSVEEFVVRRTSGEGLGTDHPSAEGSMVREPSVSYSISAPRPPPVNRSSATLEVQSGAVSPPKAPWGHRRRGRAAGRSLSEARRDIMGQTCQSIVVNAPAEKVWQAIRDFHDMGWAPNVITDIGVVGDRKGTEVGANTWPCSPT